MRENFWPRLPAFGLWLKALKKHYSILAAVWPWADRALALLTVSIGLVRIYGKTPELAVFFTGLAFPLFVLAIVFRSPPLAGPLPPISGLIGMVMSYPAVAFLEIPASVKSQFIHGRCGQIVLGACVFYVLFAAWSFYGIGRSFAIFPSARKLVTRGPYAIVRHPIYSSFLHLALCVTVLAPSARNAAVTAVMGLGVLLRAKSEEMLLSRGEAYRGFRTRVKNRFFNPVLSAPFVAATVLCFAKL